MNNDEKNVKVSVCVMTYNQKQYLNECIESLLLQDIPVSYEIIIADDCSTDGSQELIMEFKNRFPNKIFPILRNKNIGPSKNYLDLHRHARGDVVFHMDGDDLAYSNKLKVQYDEFLKDLNLVCCWHRANVFDDSRNVSRVREANLEDIVNPSNISLSDALKWGVLGCHSSMAYRKTVFDKIDFPEGEVLDIYISGCLLEYGKAINLPDILGGYRENHNVETISNRKKILFFRPSLYKHVHYEHYFVFLKNFPQYKKEIFLNSFFNIIVDLKNLRLNSVFLALKLLVKSFSFKYTLELPSYFMKKYRYSKLN